MNFSLSEEQQLFRDSVAAFVDKEVKPAAARLDESGEFPHDLFQQCAVKRLFWAALS